MAAYRKNAANDRDALFGGMGGGGNKKASSGAANRDELFGGATAASKKGGGGTTSSSSLYSQGSNSSSSDPMERLREMKKNKNRRPAMPAGEQREAKLKEAAEYRDKANQCLQKSFFGPKPDPVAASTFYKRAADAYQQVGDMPREERLYRLQSAACNELIQAWASVASDYTRAAVLLEQQVEDNIPDPTIVDMPTEISGYYQKASFAWTQLGEKSKAAGAQIKAAVALNTGSNNHHLTKPALQAMENAIEAHVPDVFNPFARYRQTGISAFIDPENADGETLAKPKPETLELAREHIVMAAYAHEPLQELVYLLVEQYREYPTALYAAGAASFLLSQDGNSTISCSRAFCTETILLLALGDAVAAQEVFLNRHVQKTFYLTARECKLSEDLFRAILNRDPDALEEARSPAGDNKAALANLHSSLRQLVTELRVSGVARKAKSQPLPSKPKASAAPPAKPSAPQQRQGSSGPGGGGPPPPGRGGPHAQQRSGGPPPPGRGGPPPPGGRGGPPPPGGRGGPPPPGRGGPPPPGRGGPPPPGRGGPPLGGRGGPPQHQQQQKQRSAPAAAPPSSPEDASLQELLKMKTGYEKEVEAGAKLDSSALAAELDGLNFGGLDDSDDDNRAGGDDDDFDLR